MKGDSSLLALQEVRNAQTRNAWEFFAEHRRKVMDLLRPDTTSPQATLCLLGAGNCNDVDLTSLAREYARIDLVDWDALALEAGVVRQMGGPMERIVLHGGVDLTSIAGILSDWRAAPPIEDRSFSDVCGRAASASLPADIQPVDTVASLGSLSQLVESCAAALQPDDPRLLGLIKAVRLGHLRQLARALRAGGKGVLVTDLVSSETAPELMGTNHTELPALLRRLLAERNFFTGLHPQAILNDFCFDPALSRLTTDRRLTAPWLWQMGPRVFAAFALVFRSPGSHSGACSLPAVEM